MVNTKDSYVVCAALDLIQLVKDVNEYVNAGFVPCGGISQLTVQMSKLDNRPVSYFVQPMHRKVANETV